MKRSLAFLALAIACVLLPNVLHEELAALGTRGALWVTIGSLLAFLGFARLSGLLSLSLALGLTMFFALLQDVGRLGLPTLPNRTLAATALIAWIWLSGALPLGIASLLPAMLFPALGVVTAEGACAPYGHPLIFLFLGGFFLARGIQRWGLHRRIALHVIHRVGTSPKRLVLGFMLATAFLSLWISNTASTLLMLPIALAVVEVMEGREHAGRSKFAIALLIGIAYSASVGGLGTPIGTPPNSQFLGQLQAIFPTAPVPSFGQWFLAMAPYALFLVFVTWGLLVFVVARPHLHGSQGREVITNELRNLGTMRREERWMALLFVLAAFLWIFRKDLELPFGFQLRERVVTIEREDGERTVRRETIRGIPGWGRLLPKATDRRETLDRENRPVVVPVDDALRSSMKLPRRTDVLVAYDTTRSGIADGMVALFVALLMFVIPAGEDRKQRLMDWEHASQIPWDILLLFGGGLSIAATFSSSGLDRLLGEALEPAFTQLGPVGLIVTVALAMTFLTEVTSNMATAAVTLPILGTAAARSGIDPVLVMMTATISCSCAFMLPIATPPNAVVFSSGRITMRRMASTGFLLNLVIAGLTTLFVWYVLTPMWGLTTHGLPPWLSGH
ncbi:MAG: SLC13/DASS family transporter [Planctomycetes bacterium]|nr:SLC13/DASS family transporter [Planctomycetota bacterium]